MPVIMPFCMKRAILQRPYLTEVGYLSFPIVILCLSPRLSVSLHMSRITCHMAVRVAGSNRISHVNMRPFKYFYNPQGSNSFSLPFSRREKAKARNAKWLEQLQLYVDYNTRRCYKRRESSFLGRKKREPIRVTTGQQRKPKGNDAGLQHQRKFSIENV